MIPLFLIPIIGYVIPISLGIFAIPRLFKLKFENIFATCYAPICIWMAGALFFGGKSLSNLVVDPLILAAAVLVLTIIRAAVTKWGSLDEKTLETWSIIASLLVALCVLLFVPALQE
jgi:hypothetical protein